MVAWPVRRALARAVQAVETSAGELMAVFDLFKRLLSQNTTDGERRGEVRVRATLGARVLVVDDSATIRAVLGKLLMQDGYEVLKAADGETAIEMAQSQFPDLIFLDIVLPGKSGFAVLRSLRHDTRTRTTPIVMMSGNQQATEQFYVQRFGADGFIKKPFGRVEVFHAIRALVQAGRMPARVITPVPSSEIPEGISPEEWAAIPDVAMPDDENVGGVSELSGDALATSMPDVPTPSTESLRTVAEVEPIVVSDDGIDAPAPTSPSGVPPASIAPGEQATPFTGQPWVGQDSGPARIPVAVAAPSRKETVIAGLAVSMAMHRTLMPGARATPGPRITVHVARPQLFSERATGGATDASEARTREDDA